MKIARVFPRKTRMTPSDPLAYFDAPGFFDEADEVHVSVTFTWDIARAEWLALQWRHVAPVKIGGPAFNQPGAAFVPGMYVGAGSEQHIRSVFAMLKEQRHPVEFTGGLEAKRLLPWHAELLAWLKPKQLFFAYDTPDDYVPLLHAAELMWKAGFTPQSHKVRAYVLMGYPRDTQEAALSRLRQVAGLGIMPFPMLWRDEGGATTREWRKLQRENARAKIFYGKSSAEKLGGLQTSTQHSIAGSQSLDPNAEAALLLC